MRLTCANKLFTYLLTYLPTYLLIFASSEYGYRRIARSISNKF